jgi:hypothetical protein
LELGLRKEHTNRSVFQSSINTPKRTPCGAFNALESHSQKHNYALCLTLTSARASRSGRRSNLSVFSRSFDFDSVSFSQLLGDNEVVNSFELCGAKSWCASYVRVYTCVRDRKCLFWCPCVHAAQPLISASHFTGKAEE